MDNKQAKQIRKGLAYAVMLFIFCCPVVVMCTSCRSTYREPIAEPAIQHSIEVARIAEAITHYGNAVDVLAADLSQGAAGLGTTLDDLSVLLEQYFAGVADLLQRYKQLKYYVDQGIYKEQDFDQDIVNSSGLDNNPDSS